jgi:hypothetical protein
MTLSEEEIKIQHTAKLEALITDVMAARRSGDNERINATLEALGQFRLDTPFIELQKKAEEARKGATKEILKEALEKLAEIVANLSSAGEIFKSATLIAETGRKELLLPRLAATASHTLEIFSQLEDSVKAVKKQIASLEELGDVPDAVKAVSKALKNLKEKVKKLETA